MEVVITLLGAGKPPLVVAAAPSEGCGAFKKRLLLLLGLPAATDCKLIYAAHGKALSGVRTFAQFGVGHRAGLQLEILDGQVASMPAAGSGEDAHSSGDPVGNRKSAGYGEVGGIQAFGTRASASSSKTKSNKGCSNSSGSKVKSRRNAQGPSKDI